MSKRNLHILAATLIVPIVSVCAALAQQAGGKTAAVSDQLREAFRELLRAHGIRVPLVLRDHPNLEGIGRLTLLQSLKCVRLVLWGEGRQRLVSFGEARQHSGSS